MSQSIEASRAEISSHPADSREVGCISELRFSIRPNVTGGVDIPPAPDGIHWLAISFRYYDQIGQIHWQVKDYEVAVLAKDVTQFFETYKEELYQKAMERLTLV